MIMAGKNVRSTSEQLVKVKVEYLYHSIRSPKPEIVAKIRQLRLLRDLDANSYRQQKTQLPYVVCAIFSPAFRNKQNFAYTEYFIVDIDHIGAKGLNLTELRARMQNDSRVVMSFVSPGEDGLKVMFRLKERCMDAGLYSVFYKSFIRSLSDQYGLEQVLDSVTSDVSRACFISVDPDAYYNPEADGVDMNAYLRNGDALSLMDQKHELDELAHEGDKRKAEEEKAERPADPDTATLSRIREVLKLAKARKQEAEQSVEVPVILNEIIGDLKRFISETGAMVTEVRNIQYAKQIHMVIDKKEAEINLYSGKHGFRIVRSTKSGTDSAMNDLAAGLIEAFLQERGLL